MRHFNIITLFLLLLSLGNCYAQFKIPNGYKELSESPASGKPMKQMIAQLDNDETNDAATIITKEDDRGLGVELLIYISQNKSYHNLKLNIEDDSRAFAFPLKIRKKVIECGYGLDGTGGIVKIFKLRYDSLAKQIRLIGFDSGYKLYGKCGGYCNKSYNLLTGEYQVKNETCEFVSDQETKPLTIIKSGVKKTNAIYITDINHDLLEQLDTIGSEYEIKE